MRPFIWRIAAPHGPLLNHSLMGTGPDRRRMRAGSSPCGLRMLGACLVLGLMMAGWPALAVAELSPRDQARVLFQEAVTMREAGNGKGALDRFTQAYRLFPHADILANMAQLAYDQRDLPAAAEYFDFLIQSNQQVSSEEVMQQAQARLTELKGVLAQITIPCRADCSEVGATIHIDGATRLKNTPLQAPFYILPGLHGLSISIGGAEYYRAAKRKHVAGGTYRLEPVKEAKPEVEPLAKGPIQVVTNPTGTRSTIGYILLATGAALGLGAGGLYLWGGLRGSSAYENDYQDPDNHNNPEALSAAHREITDAQKVMYAGHALAGAAALTLGASLYLLLTDPSRSERATRSTGRIELAPLRGGAVLSVEGRF